MIGGLVALCCAGQLGGCGGAIVHTRGDAASLIQIQNVTAVVALPPRLGFGKGGDQRRVARRTGDSLIQLTGGHAILADELASVDPELIADGIRALGEDPLQTLTFSVIAARADRIELASVPSVGNHVRPTHHFVDYTVRLDVRRADRSEILGSIETYATCFFSDPEIDRRGRALGLQRAIDDAIQQALKSFAPNLVPGEPFPTVVEIPARSGESGMAGGALAAVDRLRKLQVLYPELSLDDLASVAASNARFLIVTPGRLAALGVAPRDLVSGTGGRSLGGRGALARTMARGDMPAMSIDRAGDRFLIGQTLVARRQ